MSITLEIVTETNYKNFLKDWEPSETYSEYEDRWEKAVSVYTNFSGNTGRLYDVLYHMREYKDGFSREGDYTVNVSTKAELERILVKETDDALLNKWDDIINNHPLKWAVCLTPLQ